jgi:hypothetical protein
MCIGETMGNNKELKIGKLYRTPLGDVFMVENIKSDSRGNRIVYYYYLGEEKRVICFSEADLTKGNLKEI